MIETLAANLTASDLVLFKLIFEAILFNMLGIKRSKKDVVNPKMKWVTNALKKFKYGVNLVNSVDLYVIYF